MQYYVSIMMVLSSLENSCSSGNTLAILTSYKTIRNRWSVAPCMGGACSVDARVGLVHLEDSERSVVYASFRAQCNIHHISPRGCLTRLIRTDENNDKWSETY